jgi:hypothetical protein
MRPVRRMPPGLKQAYQVATIVFTPFSPTGEEQGFGQDEIPFIDDLLLHLRPDQRIFHMPGVGERVFTRNGALGLNLNAVSEMHNLTVDLALALTIARRARITDDSHSDSKTDLRLELGGPDNIATVSAGFVHPGHWGNLPSGEAFVLPTAASGVIEIDRAITTIGTGFAPFLIEIADDHVISCGSADLQTLIDEAMGLASDADRENVTRVCEFGIGTNPKANVSESLLELEKGAGTIHIAVGDDTVFRGGAHYAPNHTDMVMGQPTVTLDDQYKVVQLGQIKPMILKGFLDSDHRSPDWEAPRRDDRVDRRATGQAEEVDGRLYRHWTDGRDTDLKARVGSDETAQLSARVWQCFDGADKSSVRQLAERFVSRFRETNGEAQVSRAIEVLERFGLVKVST